MPPADFAQHLAANEFSVEPYGPKQARRYAVEIHDDEAWGHLARDAMIAGHVGEEAVLWTTDPSDFADLGLPEEAIVSV